MSNETNSNPFQIDLVAIRAELIAVGAITLGTLWSYWSTLAIMANKWAHDPQYSHGYLVPLFALALLWMRRDLLDTTKLKPCWWGLPIVLVSIAIRLIAAQYYFEWFDFISLVPCIFGLCLLIGGWHAVRWAWPAIGFLLFMIPLPYSLEVMMRAPLRRVGTIVSTFLMQTLGLPALAEGFVIVVGDHDIGVAEACSGLRMLMIFFALSTAVALVSEKPLWEKIVIVLSAGPIALISNILRITVTGILYATVSSEIAELVFHDLAGWLMMPLGVALLWLELWLLSRIFVVEEERPLSVGYPV